MKKIEVYVKESAMLKANRRLKYSLLAFSILLNACVATGVKEVTQNKALPRHVELTQTPFYPQEDYQCGPAALATALNTIDIRVTPEQLKPEVYIPARKGSLQIEMLATARRHGAFTMQIPPNLDALLQEIAAGNVVLVMQNLGLSVAPSWHYAVVVGYDLDKELMWLRSGTFERFEMSLSAFQRTWARSQHWAFVALPPGEIPVSIAADDLAKALVLFEKTAKNEAKFQAYSNAVERWPTHLVLLMGLGNSAYVLRDFKTAATAFKQAVLAHPNSAAAHNNLANVLLAQGEATQALKFATQALQLAKLDEDKKLQAQIQQTLDEIKAYQTAPK